MKLYGIWLLCCLRVIPIYNCQGAISESEKCGLVCVGGVAEVF